MSRGYFQLFGILISILAAAVLFIKLLITWEFIVLGALLGALSMLALSWNKFWYGG